MHKYADYEVVIFDLGNTILPIAQELTVKALHRLGFGQDILHPTEELQFVLSNYQKGKLTSDAFLSFVQAQFPEKVAIPKIIEAWNAMLLDFPIRHLQLLEQLKKSHKLMLLSNTNPLHAQCFEAKTKQYGKPLSAFFDKVYYSHEVGMSKPDSDIYRLVQKDADLKEKSVLFLDDLAENVEAAKCVDWDVVQVSQERTILDFQ